MASFFSPEIESYCSRKGYRFMILRSDQLYSFTVNYREMLVASMVYLTPGVHLLFVLQIYQVSSSLIIFYQSS